MDITASGIATTHLCCQILSSRLLPFLTVAYRPTPTRQMVVECAVGWLVPELPLPARLTDWHLEYLQRAVVRALEKTFNMAM
jgi:hypothetical protein